MPVAKTVLPAVAKTVLPAVANKAGEFIGDKMFNNTKEEGAGLRRLGGMACGDCNRMTIKPYRPPPRATI